MNKLRRKVCSKGSGTPANEAMDVMKTVGAGVSDQSLRKEMKAHKKHSRSREICDGCGDIGELFFCENCPAAYHPECDDPPIFDMDIIGDVPYKCFSCRIECNDTKLIESIQQQYSEERRTKRIANENILLLSKKESSSNQPKTLIGKAFSEIIAYSKKQNPREYRLPRHLMENSHIFPGTSRSTIKRQKFGKSEHVEPMGTVTSNFICAYCFKGTKKGPMITCDYCPKSFHLDCLDIPLTAPPPQVWLCPLHPQQHLETKLKTNLMTDRVKLWDKCLQDVDREAVIVKFISKASNRNPCFSRKVPIPTLQGVSVPKAVTESYDAADPMESAKDFPDYLKKTLQPPPSRVKYSEAFRSNSMCCQVEDFKVRYSLEDTEVSSECDKNESNDSTSGRSKVYTYKPFSLGYDVDKEVLTLEDSSGVAVDRRKTKCESLCENNDSSLECQTSDMFEKMLKSDALVTSASCSNLDLKSSTSFTDVGSEEQRESFNSEQPSINNNFDLLVEVAVSKLEEEKKGGIICTTNKGIYPREYFPKYEEGFLRKKVLGKENLVHKPSMKLLLFIEGKKKPEVEISLSRKVIRVGAEGEIPLRKFSLCPFIDKLHCIVYYEASTKSWELVNYSPNGILVNNFMYGVSNPSNSNDGSTNCSDREQMQFVFKEIMNLSQGRMLINTEKASSVILQNCKCYCSTKRLRKYGHQPFEGGAPIEKGTVIQIGCVTLFVSELSIEEGVELAQEIQKPSYLIHELQVHNEATADIRSNNLGKKLKLQTPKIPRQLKAFLQKEKGTKKLLGKNAQKSKALSVRKRDEKKVKSRKLGTLGSNSHRRPSKKPTQTKKRHAQQKTVGIPSTDTKPLTLLSDVEKQIILEDRPVSEKLGESNGVAEDQLQKDNISDRNMAESMEVCQGASNNFFSQGPNISSQSCSIGFEDRQNAVEVPQVVEAFTTPSSQFHEDNSRFIKSKKKTKLRNEEKGRLAKETKHLRTPRSISNKSHSQKQEPSKTVNPSKLLQRLTDFNSAPKAAAGPTQDSVNKEGENKRLKKRSTTKPQTSSRKKSLTSKQMMPPSHFDESSEKEIKLDCMSKMEETSTSDGAKNTIEKQIEHKTVILSSKQVTKNTSNEIVEPIVTGPEAQPSLSEPNKTPVSEPPVVECDLPTASDCVTVAKRQNSRVCKKHLAELIAISKKRELDSRPIIKPLNQQHMKGVLSLAPVVPVVRNFPRDANGIPYARVRGLSSSTTSGNSTMNQEVRVPLEPMKHSLEEADAQHSSQPQTTTSDSTKGKLNTVLYRTESGQYVIGHLELKPTAALPGTKESPNVGTSGGLANGNRRPTSTVNRSIMAPRSSTTTPRVLFPSPVLPVRGATVGCSQSFVKKGKGLNKTEGGFQASEPGREESLKPSTNVVFSTLNNPVSAVLGTPPKTSTGKPQLIMSGACCSTQVSQPLHKKYGDGVNIGQNSIIEIQSAGRNRVTRENVPGPSIELTFSSDGKSDKGKNDVVPKTVHQ